MAKAEYDKQGKYFWYLTKLAGWSEDRVNALIMKRCKAIHFNALEPREKSALIATMKRYADKNKDARMKRKRQGIMAFVAKQGHDLNWLHDRMIDWGYGESLRALTNKQIDSLRMDLKSVFHGG